MNKIFDFAHLISKNFLMLVFMFAIFAFCMPGLFIPFAKTIPTLLSIIMFAMGLTLSFDDFKIVAQKPFAIFIGLLAQFSIMPLAALIIGKALNLPNELLVGLILVGCSPGGTASNVIAYLAKGNVALSVALTSISTILAPIATPFLFYMLAGDEINVDLFSMFISVVKMILIPIVLGMFLNYFMKAKIQQISPILPAISVLCIVLVIAIVIAVSKNKLLEVSFLILIAVILHNAFGLILGYLFAKLAKINESEARVISIETGLQNSGLAVALANTHFATSPLIAVPGAIFSVWHNIAGAMLASYWSKKKISN